VFAKNQVAEEPQVGGLGGGLAVHGGVAVGRAWLGVAARVVVVKAWPSWRSTVTLPVEPDGADELQVGLF
jgi:hypothetical protein